MPYAPTCLPTWSLGLKGGGGGVKCIEFLDFWPLKLPTPGMVGVKKDVLLFSAVHYISKPLECLPHKCPPGAHLGWGQFCLEVRTIPISIQCQHGQKSAGRASNFVEAASVGDLWRRHTIHGAGLYSVLWLEIWNDGLLLFVRLPPPFRFLPQTPPWMIGGERMHNIYINVATTYPSCRRQWEGKREQRYSRDKPGKLWTHCHRSWSYT